MTPKGSTGGDGASSHGRAAALVPVVLICRTCHRSYTFWAPSSVARFYARHGHDDTCGPCLGGYRVDWYEGYPGDWTGGVQPDATA